MKISVSELEILAKNEEVDTVIVAFVDHYGRLMGKRFDVSFFLESGVKDGTHACDYLLTTDMEMEPVEGYTFSNWESGYGDFHLVPDLETMRKISWQRKTALVICDVSDEKTHVNVTIAPRSVLKAQIAKASALDFEIKAASELEYFIFEDGYRAANEQNYTDLKPAGWYLEDYHLFHPTRTEKINGAARKHLNRSEIPVENSKGEWGLGQHELNIRYAEVLEMADRHVLFKQCLKEIADRRKMSVTFMAKPHADQAGSSCHIHLSLWRDGKNAFSGTHDFHGIKCSDEFRWFLGGWIKHAMEMMPFYAPTINSYKRYVDGSWAPTRLAWSRDNRTAGFRVVGSDKSLRIECRVPGADCNPYLAYAAALASGLNGIKNKIEPPAMFEGDLYAAKELPTVPMSLVEANKELKESKFARVHLGEEVVEHYTHFFATEIHAFNSAVTDWERKRYFERI